MASIQSYKGKWRAQLKISGVRESSIFDEKFEAEAWAKTRTEELQLLKKAHINVKKRLRNRRIVLDAVEAYSLEEILNKSTPLPETCGVYFLIHNEVIVYVGQSKNVYRRTDTHKKDKNFDRITVIECLESDLDKVENFYINKFKPILNIVGKSRCDELSKISEYMAA